MGLYDADVSLIPISFEAKLPLERLVVSSGLDEYFMASLPMLDHYICLASLRKNMTKSWKVGLCLCSRFSWAIFRDLSCKVYGTLPTILRKFSVYLRIFRSWASSDKVPNMVTPDHPWPDSIWIPTTTWFLFTLILEQRILFPFWYSKKPQWRPSSNLNYFLISMLSGTVRECHCGIWGIFSFEWKLYYDLIMFLYWVEHFWFIRLTIIMKFSESAH